MRAAAFIKSTAIVAACIFSANAQTTQLNGKIDLALDDKVLDSYLAESLDHWRAFLQDNHFGFAYKGRTWAIGSLID